MEKFCCIEKVIARKGKTRPRSNVFLGCSQTLLSGTKIEILKTKSRSEIFYLWKNNSKNMIFKTDF